MSIPPINPSTTYTASRVKYTLTPTQFNLVKTEVTPEEVGNAAQAPNTIAKVTAMLAQQQAESSAVEALFFGIGQYLSGLEQEAEGLNGRVVVPITPADVTAGKTSTGVLFTPPPALPTDPVERLGPLRKTNLFGGTLAGAANETNGLGDELPYLSIVAPVPADNTAWQLTLTEEATGLSKQLAGLAIIAAVPWSVNTTAEVALDTAAQAAVVAHQAMNLTTMTLPQKAARIAAIGVRLAEVAARVTANGTARTAEYEMRFQILDSLLNLSHGFGRRDATTAQTLTFVTEQAGFFVNFGKIYSAIVS